MAEDGLESTQPAVLRGYIAPLMQQLRHVIIVATIEPLLPL